MIKDKSKTLGAFVPYSEGFQLTSVHCQTCGLAFIPNTATVCANQRELWLAAKQLHTETVLAEKTNCITPILKVTAEFCLFDKTLFDDTQKHNKLLM